jgi:hypothetical protein
MTRTEIIARFRGENAEITDRVLTDTVLNSWLEEGNIEVCIKTRCIVTDATFDSVATNSVYDTKYDLSALIPNFYDIDKYPGGGVSYDDDPLDETTVSDLDAKGSSWRTRAAGTPEKYYRRGKYLYFDYPVETAGGEIRVYAILKPDAFNNDSLEPYNGLLHLEPFHYALVLYLQKRAKMKVGKSGEELKAMQEYDRYVEWMKREINKGKFSPIVFRGPRLR